MKRHGPDHLDIEMALREHPFGRLADGRERLDQQIIERFPRVESASKVDGAGRQSLVTEGFKSGLFGVDGAHQALEFPESLAFARL